MFRRPPSYVDSEEQRMTRPLVTVVFCLVAFAPGAPRADLLGSHPQPAAAGLDPGKLAPLKGELQKYVDQHQMAGAVAVIGRRGHLGSLEAVGFQDLEKKAPMRADTVFRIASQTKISTTVAVMMLEDEGKFSVDDPLE